MLVLETFLFSIWKAKIFFCVRFFGSFVVGVGFGVVFFWFGGLFVGF